MTQEIDFIASKIKEMLEQKTELKSIIRALMLNHEIIVVIQAAEKAKLSPEKVMEILEEIGLSKEDINEALCA